MVTKEEYQAMKDRVAAAHRRRLEKKQSEANGRPTEQTAPTGDSVQSTSPKPEPSSGNPVECGLRDKKENIPKHVVRITCYRVSLQDPDNGIYKFHIDAIRHAGLIPDDTASEIQLIPLQEKVDTEAEERTEIEIFRRE